MNSDPVSLITKSNRNKNEDGRSSDPDIRSEPWWYLALPIVIGMLTLPLLGGLISGSWTFALIIFLIATAATAAGGLLGFLFGIPRSGISDTSGPDERQASSTIWYRPSTNLEQVSDWLTKLLIGVGLVQMREITTALAQVGEIVQGSIGPPIVGASIITQATILSFLLFAFMTGFLWTRIYYGPLQLRIDRTVLSSFSAKLEQFEIAIESQRVETEKAVHVTGLFAKGEISTIAVPQRQTDLTEAEIIDFIATWPENVRKAYENFERAPRKWDSDPGKALFPTAKEEDQTLALTGAVVEELPDVLIIRLRVSPIANAGAVSGPVVFLLHPTLGTPIRHASPADGVAEIKFPSQGWFTAVAIANEGRSVLSLDLRKVPGVPDWFVAD